MKEASAETKLRNMKSELARTKAELARLKAITRGSAIECERLSKHIAVFASVIEEKPYRDAAVLWSQELAKIGAKLS